MIQQERKHSKTKKDIRCIVPQEHTVSLHYKKRHKIISITGSLCVRVQQGSLDSSGREKGQHPLEQPLFLGTRGHPLLPGDTFKFQNCQLTTTKIQLSWFCQGCTTLVFLFMLTRMILEPFGSGHSWQNILENGI